MPDQHEHLELMNTWIKASDLSRRYAVVFSVCLTDRLGHYSNTVPSIHSPDSLGRVNALLIHASGRIYFFLPKGSVLRLKGRKKFFPALSWLTT